VGRATPNLGVEPVLFYRKEVKMSRFWDLVKDSTIVQGLITLAVVLTTCYLWVSGQPVPQELWTANGIILGFFFGAKATQIVRR
jgi:hypothetical protein